MSITRQLYQLQELDLEIDSHELDLKQKTSQLGDSPAVLRARDKLASQRQQLEELKREQHSTEWEIDDLSSKIATLEQKLYGGGIGNPKELSSLQRESEGFKARRSQLEDKALEIMDRVELTEASVTAAADEFNKLEAEWRRQQQGLTSDIEKLKNTLSQLGQKRQLLLADIDPKIVPLYQELRSYKGTAVAKVDQGMCRGCRILLPAIELQKARGGSLVQCGSCRRILFLA
ncbi:zinc ribbon domain-containing protein [Chloroflexota bacterium]